MRTGLVQWFKWVGFTVCGWGTNQIGRRLRVVRLDADPTARVHHRHRRELNLAATEEGVGGYLGLRQASWSRANDRGCSSEAPGSRSFVGEGWNRRLVDAPTAE